MTVLKVMLLTNDQYLYDLYQSDLTEFQKFRSEDIPAKLANKRRLEILFYEIEVSLYSRE